jgi:TetR/AcrR family transcriptional regulator, repressor of fatR-cypB operon
LRTRDEAKQQRILAGALALVERQGLAGLSMDAVAKAAEVAIGTLYIYFENKEALLNALYLETKRSFAREVFESATPGEPVRKAFERMCIAYMHYVQQNRAAIVFLQQFRNSPFLYEQTLAETAGVNEPVLALFERGKAEGLFKDLPAPLMIAFVQSTLTELSAYAAAEPRKTRKESYLQIAQLAWDALKA